MYNKKYRLTNIDEFNHKNPIYTNILGSICYLAYLNPGERGWFLAQYDPDDWRVMFPHRIHTSIVKDVEYDDNRVILTTENTRFVFELIRSAGDEED